MKTFLSIRWPCIAKKSYKFHSAKPSPAVRIVDSSSEFAKAFANAFFL